MKREEGMTRGRELVSGQEREDMIYRSLGFA